MRKAGDDVPVQCLGHLVPEVKERAQHGLLVFTLFLQLGSLVLGYRVNGSAQSDDAVGFDLVAFVGGLLDAQALFLITQCCAVVAVGATEQRKDFLAVRTAIGQRFPLVIDQRQARGVTSTKSLKKSSSRLLDPIVGPALRMKPRRSRGRPTTRHTHPP